MRAIEGWERMRKTWLIFSILLIFIGLIFGFVYSNPFGFVIEGIGTIVFFYSILSKPEESRSQRFVSRKQYLKRMIKEDYRCGTCFWFGKPGCKRNEKLLNSEPCEDYMLSSTK